jgi:hypothetical protein
MFPLAWLDTVSEKKVTVQFLCPGDDVLVWNHEVVLKFFFSPEYCGMNDQYPPIFLRYGSYGMDKVVDIL